jgi:formyl-CoA transferase/CoA:oxalate CoA-transferase
MRPLENLFVLDLTHVIAGPFCTQMLGDMGANVVKVERLGRGDHSRAWSPKWNGIACAFLAFNRNKRSLAIDLKQPAGAGVIRQLADKADVIIESLRPGSADQLGLAYDEVASRNPRVVYCSISGYGQTGPNAPLGGYDLIAQAFGGLMSVTGEPDGPPVRAGYSVFDMFAGMAAYGGIMTALLQRERSGRGQYVETSLIDGAIAQMSYHAVGYLATGDVPRPLGTASPSLVPYQLFQASDAVFILGCNNDDAYRRLCTALGRMDLATDAKFATNADRLKNRASLIEILGTIFRARTASDWVALLNANQVPASRVNTVADVVQDSQVTARGLLQAIPHPTIEGLKAPASPFQLADAPSVTPTSPPSVGQHTDEILGELGYSADEVSALRDANVVG